MSGSLREAEKRCVLNGWKIFPAEQAEVFADKSASLARALRRAQVEELAKVYEEINGMAIEARDNFKITVAR